MKLCDICGNEIPGNVTVCPFCDSPLKPNEEPATTARAARIETVVIKDGFPTVDEALEKLSNELSKAGKKNIALLKVIHGYGSSGEGGLIKIALHAQLRKLAANGQIRKFVTGEEHFNFAGKRNPLLTKYPELLDTWKSDRGNPGITFIEL